MNRERVTLRQIVDARLLEVPTELRATYQDQVFTAQLLSNGTIDFKGAIFTAPSMALGAARNLAEGRAIDDPMKPTGGWPYWHYFDGQTQEWTPLEVLRKRFLRGTAKR